MIESNSHKEVQAMAAPMTPSEVHKQYNEAVTAFRKLIPDPALRMSFSRQIDGYMRQ